jgi:predicted TIM-barrel enzyme
MVHRTVCPPTVQESGLRCQPVAMIHLHCTSAVLNHAHAKLLGVQVPTAQETKTTSDIVGKLQTMYDNFHQPLVDQMTRNCRSVVFLDRSSDALVQEFGNLPYARALVDRAVEEAGVYFRNGIRVMEIENVVAPYFIGPGACPWEELVLLLLAARAVRAAHPDVCLGVHILSCIEQEVLPIAIDVGAYFVRSEATLFEGVRPEGRTKNESNLARFLYLRRVLRQVCTADPDVASAEGELAFPQIWSDIQKKHTVWPTELLDDQVWLHNIPFVKLEGIIVTGPETGSNVREEAVANARVAIDKAKAFVRTTVMAGADAGTPEPPLPLVTGSGGDFEMYCRYADFMIVGTAFKRGSYWENPVDEANVKTVLDRIRAAQPTA